MFCCVGFSGHWPIGTSAIVVDETKEDAKKALVDYLENNMDLPQKDDLELAEVFPDVAGVFILNDGDY